MRERSRWRACFHWLCRGEAGQALVWTAVMLPLFLSVIGLAIDAGTIFDARRELQNVADSAARAGAMQIDQARVKIPSSTHTAPTVSTAIRVTAQIDAKGNPIPCRNPATAGMPL